MVHRAWVVAVGMLVVLAGCSAPLGDESRSTDATPTSTDGPPASAPYRSLTANATEVVETHREQLRATGSVTRHYERRYVSNGSEGSERRHRERTARIDFGTQSASMLTTDPDGEYWQGPNRSLERTGSPPQFSRYAGPRAFTYGLEANRFDYYRFGEPERVERDGETLFRYRVTGLADDSNVTVRNATGRMLLRPDGLIRSVRLRLVVDRGDETVRNRLRIDHEKPGRTSVSRPSWSDDAVAAVGPDRDDVVTVERSAPELGARLTLTGPAGSVSEEFSTRNPLRRSSNPRFRNQVLDGSRASCLVTVELPPGSRNGTLSLDYTPSLVPSGEEANLSLVRHDDRRNTFVPVTTATFDTDRNVVTAPAEPNEAYFVMHRPTFREAFDEDDVRVAPDATGVPDCGG
jgi:hypothetical protein